VPCPYSEPNWVSPPYDSAEVTAYLAGRVVLEALSGIAWRRRRVAGEPVRHPADPLLANRPAQQPHQGK